MLSIHEVTFAYPDQPPIFERFSWHVATGDTWTVLGPSGCGKSTLLLLLAGLLQPQEGTVELHNKSLERPRPSTGLILQDYGLLPWATLRENVALGLRIRRFYGPDGRHAPNTGHLAESDAEARVDHWLHRLDIVNVADKTPGQVSGGQRQRTAIGRALVLEPDLLLMDEPFSALDAPTRENLQMVTLGLCAEANLTIVLVTHSVEEAAFVGQHTLLLAGPPNHEPRILENQHLPSTTYRQSAAYRTACSTLREGLG